jgi:CheY-like chemotaxis protein
VTPAPLNLAPRASGLDLLVVDDHPVNRRYMALLLRNMGHQARLAANAEEALAEVQRRVPQLVFMDLHMPDRDGFDTTRALRALPGLAGQVPVVALTADVFSETRHKVQAAGMLHFLAKPVQPDEIMALLLQRFGVRPVEPQSASAADLGWPAQDGAIATQPPCRTDTPDSDCPLPMSTRHQPPLGSGPARRFRSSDVGIHLDMAMIGDVCVGISLDGLREVLASFLADASGQQAALLAELDAGRTDQLRQRAHALKGSAASLGLRSVQALAGQIETRAEQLRPDECSELAATLRLHLADSQALLARMGFV